ncbi:hypothetical protein B0H17DRAFT_1156689 [Mycena rosella]|uniref:DUF7726 domain-containing protein n=1 Tax=Mycena rosella TaxID=1033263 RepID=A0AAD7GVY9_MYCRO|nr:hypothetical protein B0H17DRAFT_1156689 [Mycena rosella]
MAPKRKSDVSTADLEAETFNENDTGEVASTKSNLKKARVSVASSSSSSSKAKSKDIEWRDVELDTNSDGTIPVFDFPGEVRRKIRVLQGTPGWKVTVWLKEIGGVNHNSYSRFMAEKNKAFGAANSTYFAAYVYFEKVRIAEGKKKSAGRKQNEIDHPFGFPLEDQRKVWVFGPA